MDLSSFWGREKAEQGLLLLRVDCGKVHIEEFLSVNSLVLSVLPSLVSIMKRVSGLFTG